MSNDFLFEMPCHIAPQIGWRVRLIWGVEVQIGGEVVTVGGKYVSALWLSSAPSTV